MTRVLVDDPDLPRQLLAARAAVEICDSTGLAIGRFVPQGMIKDGAPGEALTHSGEVQDDEFWKSVGME